GSWQRRAMAARRRALPITLREWLPARTVPKQACGSSPKPRTCRRSSSRLWSPMVKDATSCRNCRPRTTRCLSVATACWIRNASNMSTIFVKLGEQRKAFADWTDRIAAGAYPKQAPPRPTGVERNLVISMWDWALPTSRRSDMAATDERTPTMNANGLIYGAIQSSDILAVLDPRANATTMIKIPSHAPVIDANTPASPYWGDEKVWQRQSDPRSTAMDSHGRVWVTARTRA